MEINITNSKKVTIDTQSSKSFFRDYKDFILPIVVIIGSLLILFFVVLPQLNQYFVSSKQLSEETQKLNVLKNNYNFLTNLDETQTTSNLSLLSKVLPPNKDFTGILNSISIISSKTNVSIGNFSFALGDLAKTSDLNGSFPLLKMEVNLGGDAQGVVKFMDELNKSAPLAEVKVLKGTGKNYLLTIVFYYKPFPPQNISDEEGVVPLSSQNSGLLKNLDTWNNVSNQENVLYLPDVSASASAGSNPSPF